MSSAVLAPRRTHGPHARARVPAIAAVPRGASGRPGWREQQCCTDAGGKPRGKHTHLLQEVKRVLLGHSLAEVVDVDGRSVFRLAHLAGALDEVVDEELQAL